MMNPSAILQVPTGAGAADTPRIPSRQAGTDGKGGAFPDLLAKLKAAVQPESDAIAAPQQNERQPAVEELLDLLRGNAEPSDPAEVPPGQNVELSGLVQVLGDGTTTSADLAALLARMAAGTDTDADEARITAMMAQGNQEATPNQAILAALAKLSGREAGPAQAEDDAVVAVMTVLGRETHLAPAQTMAAAGVHSQWAAEVAQRARQAAQAAMNAKPGDMGTTAVQQRDQANGYVQLAAPGLAVAATEDAQLGANLDRRGSPWTDARWAADTLLAPQLGPAAGTVDVLPSGGGATVGVAQQIADQVVGEASALTSAVRPDIPTFVRHESPTKVLRIQLQPAELGTVTIRMSVKDNALRLDLEAGRGDTVRLIQRDQDALSTMLRSAGYLIDGMEVRLADQASAGGQSSMGQANSQAQGGQSGSSQQDNRSWGERHGREQPHDPFSQRGHGDDEQAGRTGGRGGVYI
jgi:flagellar hook-length control protein FliK